MTPRGAIHHLALAVSDLAAAEAAFYGPVLRFLGYERVEEGDGFTVWWSRAAGSAVNLWQARLEGPPHDRHRPGFHHLAFAAESRDAVDRLHDLLRTEGVAVLDPPAEYPHYAPGYYAVFFEGPDGLKFELVHTPADTD